MPAQVDEDGLAVELCSTPFGDIDGFTVITSASESIASLCSTPFGDIDGFTWWTSSANAPHSALLNAFRRH